MYIKHILSKVVKLSLISIILLGCSNNKWSLANNKIEDKIVFDFNLLLVSNDIFEIYDFSNDSYNKVNLNLDDLQFKSANNEYSEIIYNDKYYVLPSINNIVYIDRKDYSLKVFDSSVGLKNTRISKSIGIGNRSLEILGDNIYYLLDIGMLSENGETWAFCTQYSCNIFDDYPYGAGTYVTAIDDEISALLHIVNKDDDYFGNEIMNKTYSLDGIFKKAEVVDLGFRFGEFLDYFIVGNTEYFEVSDNEKNYLVSYTKDEVKKIEFDYNEYWGRTKGEGRKVDGEILYLYLQKDVVVDLNSFEIIDRIQLDEMESEENTVLYSFFGKNNFYIVDHKRIYIYSISDFKLLKVGNHGINFRDKNYTIGIVE